MIYPGTSSVESDCALVKSIKTELNGYLTHISNIALEGCIHSKQFNYLIQITIFLYNFYKKYNKFLIYLYLIIDLNTILIPIYLLIVKYL